MSCRLWPTPRRFAPLFRPYVVTGRLNTTVLRRLPDELRWNTRRQGTPTCGEPSTFGRCVTTAEKSGIYTVAALQKTGPTGFLRRCTAPHSPANDTSRSTSTFLTQAVEQRASATHLHPILMDQRAVTPLAEVPPTQEGETKGAVSGGEVVLRRKNENPLTTHRRTKDQDSRRAHSPTRRSNADMIRQRADSHTARCPPDIAKPAVNKTTPSSRRPPTGTSRDTTPRQTRNSKTNTSYMQLFTDGVDVVALIDAGADC